MSEARITLVGAGCKDRGWLTQDAVKALKECEVLVYDDLVHPSILELAHQAEWIYVGKRSGRHYQSQDEINALLIQLAKNHKNVVRLKGGDSFVFGRGMEEKLVLEDAGFTVNLVPGISSCIAIPEKMNIPLTHRSMSSSFLVCTPSGKNGTLSEDLDFELLAKYKGTIVVLMGLKRIGCFMNQLLEAGKDKSTPCAILSSEDIAHTQCWKTTIAEAEKTVLENEVPTPAILVIGKTAQFARNPDAMPSITVGTFCSPDFSGRLQNALPESIRCLLLARMIYTDLQIPKDVFLQIQAVPCILSFTSEKGVRVFLKECRQNRLDLRKLGHCQFAAIGKQTARALEEAGIYPEWVAAHNTGSLEKLLEEKAAGQHLPVFSFRSENADDCMEQNLLASGIDCTRVDCYSIAYQPTENLHSVSRLDGLVFASASSGEWFYQQPESKEVNLPVFALSAISGKAAKKAGAKVLCPEKISAASLGQRIEEYFKMNRSKF